MYPLSNLILTYMYIKPLTMKYLLIFLLCLMGPLSYGQVYKLKTFQSFFKKSTDKHHLREDEWNDVDFLAVINIDKNKINTYGKEEGDYDLVKFNWKDKNEQGDNYWDWDAIDEKGEKCEILLVVFADKSGKHIATLTFIYPAGSILLRLKKDD